eukprot:TRINITY_DN1672_c0_g1_i1.p1 TRINITY_DN1672_c0_g1~~TRINITY_DN1672_c0_g1_i1.p1  ORF type:complete len:320 (+),score=74.57 TRINITY_DN1672_c0_g1_i1:28-960(+)
MEQKGTMQQLYDYSVDTYEAVKNRIIGPSNPPPPVSGIPLSSSSSSPAAAAVVGGSGNQRTRRGHGRFTADEKGGDSHEWVMVDSEENMRLVDAPPSTASGLLKSVNSLDDEKRSALAQSFSSVEGSQDILHQLQNCIESKAFQDRVFRKICARDPNFVGDGEAGGDGDSMMAGISQEEMKDEDGAILIRKHDEEEELENLGFVPVSHEGVVEALAEHLVLVYIENYHADEIQALRNAREAESWYYRVTGTLGRTVGDLSHIAGLDFRSIVRRDLPAVGLTALSAAAGSPTAMWQVAAILGRVVFYVFWR